jgi:translocation and assembly module TamB
MNVDRSSIVLPAFVAKQRADWTARIAKVLCTLLALVGALPFAVTLLVRLPAVRARVVDEVQKVLKKEGIHASFQLEMGLWPLAVELNNVRVESTDGRGPAVTAPRAVIKPKVFGLLSGKVVLDEVDLTSPSVRLVINDKGISNLGIKFPEKKDDTPSGPFYAPFSVVSLSDATLDITYNNDHVQVFGLDADVSAEDQPALGSALELAVRANRIAVTRRREEMEGGFVVLATDEDEICGLDGRVRFDPPRRILVRRLTLRGGADLDPGEGTFVGCNLAEDDARRVELTLGRVTVDLPVAFDFERQDGRPKVEGHVSGRAPVALVNRIPGVPDTAGWVSIDANVRYSPADKLPEADGKVRVHGVRVDTFSFAENIESKFSVHRDVIESSETKVRIANGDAVLSNVAVEPFAPNMPIRATVAVKNAEFDTLLKNLGVHKHPHVGWDLMDVQVPNFRGTLNPLKLDGDLHATTANFGVYDAPADSRTKGRIVGFARGIINGKIAVRPDAVVFSQVRGVVGRSIIEGGFVSLGYNNVLKVDVPSARIDLADISPVGSLKLSGQADAKVHVSGVFGKPIVEGSASIQNFVLGDIPLGNISQAKVRVEGTTVELSGVKAQKGKSPYELTSGRIILGGSATMEFDADVASTDFGVRDFFSLWHMENDPRFLDLDGQVATRVGVRVVLGGPEDLCGGGLIQASAAAVIRKANLYGEKFDDAHVDFDYNWTDRGAGIYGADVTVRSFALHKVHRADQTPIGTVLGSATIHKGALKGSAVFDTYPLSRVDMLGEAQDLFAGSVSGLAIVSGSVDNWNVSGNAGISPVRINGERFGSSQVHFVMTNEGKLDESGGRTRCGGPIGKPFNRAAYDATLDDKKGEFVLDGSLLGGQVVLQGARMTREPKPTFSGRIGLRKLDIGAVTRVISPPENVDWSDEESEHLLSGYVTGDINVDEFATAHPERARGTFTPTQLSVASSGQTIELKGGKSTLSLKDNTLTVPALGFTLAAGGGLTGAFTVDGAVRRAMTTPALDLSAEITPVDLSVLSTLFPRINRAAGQLSGSVRVTGQPTQPDIDGALEVRGGEYVVSGMPTISRLNVDLRANGNELRLTRATAAFAGGDISATGRIPLRGASRGELEATLTGRDLRMTPADGIRAVFDCDLTLAGALFGARAGANRLPRVTGEVLLQSLDYTRNINLDLAQTITGNTKRTAVESYDPALDRVALDITVNARAPIRVRNNLAEFQLGIDAPGLNVVGTDQRIGLRGGLRSSAGGRLSFLANEFELRQATIRFDDATRIAPIVDALAVTEYRRYTSAASGQAAGRTGGSWRISLHAYGPADQLRLDMTSEPTLSQEDISLLLTVGLTKAEADQLGTNALSVFAYEAAGTASGADRAVKKYIPIDDFRFGSAYSPRTGRSEPNFTIGKRLTSDIQANVTSGISEDRQIRTSIEWRLTRSTSVQAAYDNVNTINASSFGNLGLDLRWRLEFE